MSESQEWQEVLNGDGEAFGRIFDFHKQRIFHHALRFTQNRHDAEDVVAAAFLELWRRRKDVRIVEGSVAPWLLITATNIGLNQARGLRRYRNFLSRLPREEPTYESADKLALQNATIDIEPDLRKRIKELKAMDQQLLALIAFEDFSLRSAADALGISEQAARSRWQRIRRRLAEPALQSTLTALLGESK